MTHAINVLELPDAAPGQGAGAPLIKDRIGALKSVKANVSVVAGHAETTIAHLLDLKHGAVLELDRAVGAKFDLVLEGQVIARGELVAVNDMFGLRITEVADHEQT